jgi:hypothetical protein
MESSEEAPPPQKMGFETNAKVVPDKGALSFFWYEIGLGHHKTNTST